MIDHVDNLQQDREGKQVKAQLAGIRSEKG